MSGHVCGMFPRWLAGGPATKAPLNRPASQMERAGLCWESGALDELVSFTAAVSGEHSTLSLAFQRLCENFPGLQFCWCCRLDPSCAVASGFSGWLASGSLALWHPRAIVDYFTLDPVSLSLDLLAQLCVCVCSIDYWLYFSREC